MHKTLQTDSSPNIFSQYGINTPSHAPSTPKFSRKNSAPKDLIFSKKNSSNLNKKPVNVPQLQTPESKFQSRPQKKFIRSNSNGKIPRASSSHLLAFRRQFLGETKKNEGSIQHKKCVSQEKGLKERESSPEIQLKMKETDEMEQLKITNKKLNRQIARLNQELYIKNVQISDLKKDKDILCQKLSTLQGSVNQKNKENLDLRSVLEQNYIKISHFEQIIKEKQSSTQFSISTKEDSDKFFDSPQTSTIPIIEIDTQVIISNLQKAIKYQQIQIGMLKKNRFEMDEMKIECLLWKKENKALKNEIKRLRDNQSMIKRQPFKDNYIMEESISLEISKQDDSRSHRK